MGTFRTSVAVMQQAVGDLATARDTIKGQLTAISTTTEHTLSGWQGAGGTGLRALMIRYDEHARALQTAVDAFQTMLADQARLYGVNDENAAAAISSVGAGLQM